MRQTWGMWPASPSELESEQHRIAGLEPEAWEPPDRPGVAGCYVCFGRGTPGAGAAGDRGWAAAAVVREHLTIAESVIGGVAGAPYAPGLLALREGPLLSAALDALDLRPDVVIVDATGRDHPRRCGLALHLGHLLGIPTVGVTHRPLLASGRPPEAAAGSHSALVVDGEVVGAWVRVVAGARPLAVHAAWRTSPDLATRLILSLRSAVRTPEPLRRARQLARTARAHPWYDYPMGYRSHAAE